MSKTADVPYETTVLVRDTCLCLHVQRAARALARRFDEALKPLGLTNGQFSMLVALSGQWRPRLGELSVCPWQHETLLSWRAMPR